MKIAVIGTRGIPGIQGGVETVCEELYPRIAALGHDVTVMCRNCYLPEGHPTEWRGVRLMSVNCPRRKSIEAIVHTWRALLKARAMHPDVVHIHAVGPALLTPMARLMGLRVVMTNHGPDYDRAKWGRLAKAVLKAGESLGTRFSNRVIAIAPHISEALTRMYGRRDIDLIPNGVEAPEFSSRTDYIESLGLEPGRYVLAVGRFVKEKGFHDLIEAWRRHAPEGYRLAIAGDADHEDDYSRSLKAEARRHGVVLAGFIRGEKMAQLAGNAALQVMPSYHEGLPIALLEGMSRGLDVAVSDIPACRLPELDPDADFFAPGDIDAIGRVIARKLADGPRRRSYDLSRYDWDAIAKATVDVYAAVTNPSR